MPGFPITYVPRGVPARRNLSAAWLILFFSIWISLPLPAQTPGPSGNVLTIAGSGALGFGGDGGPAINANFNFPFGLAIGRDGSVFIADGENNRVRAIDPATGFVNTIAGNGGVVVDDFDADNNGDGGPAVNASITSLYLATDPGRHLLYLVDFNNFRVRQVDLATGVISKFAGLSLFNHIGPIGDIGDGGPANQAYLPDILQGIGVAPNHDVFISGLCRVRSVNGGTGTIQTIAGLPDPGIPYNTICASSGDGGPASAAGLGNPGDIKADLAGNLYIIDGDHTVVRRIDATTGIITRFAGGGSTIPGTGPALAMNLGNVRCIASSDDGFLYISNDTRVFRVDLVTTELTPVAGNGNAGFSGDNGPALQAEFDTIAGLAAAPGGGLFVSDSLNQRIRYIVPNSIFLSGNMTLTAIRYPFVSALTGNLIITNNPNAGTISLGSVTTVSGSVDLSDNNSAGLVGLGSLTTVSGSVRFAHNISASSVNLSALNSVGGNISVRDNTSAGSVNLSSLTSLSGDCEVLDNSAAGSVKLSSLSTVNGQLSVGGNLAAGTVDLGNLTSTGGDFTYFYNSTIGSIDLGSLTSVGGSLLIFANSSAHTIDLSGLTSVGAGQRGRGRAPAKKSARTTDLLASGGSISVSLNDSATFIDLSSLTTIGGGLTVAYNAPTVVVNLNNVTTIGDGANVVPINLQGGTFLFANGLNVGAFNSLGGHGTISGHVTNAGQLVTGVSSPGRFDITGNLLLTKSAEFLVELGENSPGNFAFLTAAGQVTLGGVLSVSLVGIFPSIMSSGAGYTLLTSAHPLGGEFTNVASGGTLFTTDGYARFTVNYAGANAVQLSGLVIVDTDNDGLPDWWEDQFGLNKNSAADGLLDSDGDGLSNLEEFRAGTSPNNSASAFRIVAVTRQANDVHVSWSAVGGKSYRIQASDQLTNQFIDISSQITAPGSGESVMEFVDSGAASGPQRFYRVRLEP